MISVFDFIENEFDIEINKIRSDETLINTNLIHIALSVPNLYNALNGVFRSIDETDILRFYSTQFNNIDSMLKVIYCRVLLFPIRLFLLYLRLNHL